ncbi:MAG: hypothetical protein V3U29_04565, partial [Phycisphaeraceae bacterium]
MNVIEDHSGQIRQTLTDAWNGYRQQADGELTAAGFRAYAQATAEQNQALEYLNRLDKVLTTVQLVGITGLEYQAVVNAVLAPITPEGMAQAQLYAAITAPAPAAAAEPTAGPAASASEL